MIKCLTISSLKMKFGRTNDIFSLRWLTYWRKSRAQLSTQHTCNGWDSGNASSRLSFAMLFLCHTKSTLHNLIHRTYAMIVFPTICSDSKWKWFVLFLRRISTFARRTQCSKRQFLKCISCAVRVCMCTNKRRLQFRCSIFPDSISMRQAVEA